MDGSPPPSAPEKLISILEENHKLTRNGAVAARESLHRQGAGELIRKLLELNVNSEVLAQTLSVAADLPVFPNLQRPSERPEGQASDEHPEIIAVGSGTEGEEWAYAGNGVVYFVNPFEVKKQSGAIRDLRKKFDNVSTVGVMSKASFTAAASMASYTASDVAGEFQGEGDTGKHKAKLNSLLMAAVRQVASDIHFIPHANDVRAFLRVENRLKMIEAFSYPDYLGIANVILTKTAKGKPGTYLAALDDQFVFVAPPNRTVKVRVMMVPVTVAEQEGKTPRFCLRIPNAGIEKLSVGDLGIPDTPKNPSLTLLRMTMECKNGLILVSGPTGSGKTTTLMAIMAEMQRMYPDKCRYTVEDPVEMNMSGVSHVQVDEEADLTFARAIKSFLRGDPDEIMVGEIRDGTVGGLALTASITGHLTFATIHTNSAVEVIARLIDMGCDAFIVADAMRAATAQRLVRRVCKFCSEEAKWGDLVTGNHPVLQHPDNFIMRMHYQNAPKLYADLDSYPQDPNAVVRLAKNGGCNACGLTGYKGRALVTEILEITPDLAEMISKRSSTAELKRHALKNGFKDMWQHGGAEVWDKQSTTFDEMVKTLGERVKFSLDAPSED